MTMPEDAFSSVFAAVPGWMAKVAEWTAAELAAACEDTADLIASGGELLLFGIADTGRRRKPAGDLPPEPTTTDVAEAVARGLAILAQAPGGVTVLGRHWCTDRHDGCPGPGSGSGHKPLDRKGTGAYYTPRFLAEKVTVGGLEPLVYSPGPLQTADTAKWRLRPSGEIAALNIGDIALGAGVFAVATIRYLADRVQEAWAAEGVTGDLAAARRTVARCMHGGDVNGSAVELAKIAVGLITFDRAQPNLPLDRQFIVGDSLLGIISLQQLAWLHADAERGKTLHAADPALVAFPRRLATCISVLTRRLPVLDPASAEWRVAKIALGIVTDLAKPLADLATGAALASGGKDRAWGRLSMEAARLAASFEPPPRPDTAPAWLAMPVVYAAPATGPAGGGDAAGEAGALFTADAAGPGVAWHIADPTTDRPTTWATRDHFVRTWFMCGGLVDCGDVVYTRTAPDGVCGECLAQVEHVNRMLGTCLRAGAEGLRAALSGEVA